MPTFIVRVELHPADREQQHSAVHLAMEAEGFSRIYTDRDGLRYHLPASEYCLIADNSIEDVRERGRVATSRITTHFMLLVTEAVRVASWGLVPVQETRPKTAPGLASPRAA